MGEAYIQVRSIVRKLRYIDSSIHSQGHILDLVFCAGIKLCNISTAELPISEVVLFDTYLPVMKSKVHVLLQNEKSQARGTQYFNELLFFS